MCCIRWAQNVAVPKVPMLVSKKKHVGASENVVYPDSPNGFADHCPYEKWRFHWEYSLFSDKPM